MTKPAVLGGADGIDLARLHNFTPQNRWIHPPLAGFGPPRCHVALPGPVARFASDPQFADPSLGTMPLRVDVWLDRRRVAAAAREIPNLRRLPAFGWPDECRSPRHP